MVYQQRRIKMNKFKSCLTIAILVLTTALINPDHAIAQSGDGKKVSPAVDTKVTDVRVVNTNTEPVPTIVQGTTSVTGTVMVEGTPNVNIANTPTVGLASGTNVGISGTPNVNIANKPTVS